MPGLKPTASTRAARDGLRVASARCIQFEDQPEPVEAQCCWVRPGHQKLIVTGSLESPPDVLRKGAEMAYTLVCTHILVIKERLQEVVGLSSSPNVDYLVRGGHDIHMHLVYESTKEIYHGVYKAAMAMSFISLLGNRQPRPDTIVVGDVGPTGKIHQHPDDWTRGLVKKCQRFKIRRAIIAEDLYPAVKTLKRAALVMEDGLPTLLFIRRKYIWDAIGDVFVKGGSSDN